MMPKKMELIFLVKFRKSNLANSIIMLTADSQLEKKQSYLFGCDDYLIKPFEPTELV